MDNFFIERLWCSLKYEAVHLHELSDVFHAGRVIAEWIGFYLRAFHHLIEHILRFECSWRFLWL